MLLERLLASREDRFEAVRCRLDDGGRWVERHRIGVKYVWKPVASAEIKFDAADDDMAGCWTITDGLATSATPDSVRLLAESAPT